MSLPAVSLDDKYLAREGQIFLSGTQALVRLLLLQRERDQALGLNTAGFVAGYRGSPLGALDLQLARARARLDQHRIVFQPALNEDLAATMLWGTQQLQLWGDATVDGVFGMWYGKAPGVDRSGDAFRHAHGAGTAQKGGVLAVFGDDHGAKSSTVAGHSEFAFIDLMVPILYPATVDEIIEYGLYGWALSRASGGWVALKILPETADASTVIRATPTPIEYRYPAPEFALPPDGVHLRWPDTALAQERRLHRYKLPLVKWFAHANPLDRAVITPAVPDIGIVTAGKAYLDVMQALRDLGLDPARVAELGIGVYKVAMPWPLESSGVETFAARFPRLLVIEEKRAVIEPQLKELFYARPSSVRPQITGKADADGRPLVPSDGELGPALLARLLVAQIPALAHECTATSRLEALTRHERDSTDGHAGPERIPHFCSGCPHNTSTVVPAGSRALAGIGCHYMAQWMDRSTATFTHMGGEGATWIGQSPFSTTAHVFVNIGDGTYNHSGSLAVRAAVAAGVNVTYKLLYNDAVAMTGGQQVDGHPEVGRITFQLHGEGVRRIAIVTDEPTRYRRGGVLAPGVTVHVRNELDAVQRVLREIPGVTVLIYDQTCASEKRRRRKRGVLEDPARRVFIHEAICDGCGDCGVQSNCLSVVPFETEFGRKRAIDQSSCNKDFRCLDGLCPSFVTVEGGVLRRAPALAQRPFEVPPDPVVPGGSAGPWGILVAGVGGTGVVTIGALLGMAARLDGRACLVLDQTGLAQKFGAVMTHVQIAERDTPLYAGRLTEGGAHLLLGADLVTAASDEGVKRLLRERTAAVLNIEASIVAAFTRERDLDFGAEPMRARVAAHVDPERLIAVDATRLATALLGNSIATNLFLVGIAYQKGWLPLSGAALEQAIRLNGVSVDFNLDAFQWGRRYAHRPEAVRALSGLDTAPVRAQAWDDLVASRAAYLQDYQDSAYAARYRALTTQVREVERRLAPGRHGLADAVARNYFKLLAYKDEYEVARLLVDGPYLAGLRARFDGPVKVKLHLAPPLFARRDPRTGRPRKRAFGSWLLPALRVLARLRRVRGSILDPFGYTQERRQERRLIVDYERMVREVIGHLDHANYDVAVELCALPDEIRGFGVVKERAIDAVESRWRKLQADFRAVPRLRDSA